MPAGFAEVLVPLANGLLLGVERDADSSGRVAGLKLALFDIANPASPTERVSLSLGAVGSSSALDSSRHGLNLRVLGDAACVALPDNLANTVHAGWRHGLQTLEVDTAARTLRARTLAAARDDTASLWHECRLRIGDGLSYLGNGRLGNYGW